MQVLLIGILASDTNFGYVNAGWRVLDEFNGTAVRSLAHLYLLYVLSRIPCVAPSTHSN